MLELLPCVGVVTHAFMVGTCMMVVDYNMLPAAEVRGDDRGREHQLTIGQSSHMRALTHTLETKGSVNWSRSQSKTN